MNFLISIIKLLNMQMGKMFYMNLAGLLILSSIPLHAQDEPGDSNFSISTDFYSSFVFRGTKLGQGPSVQPDFKYVNRGLTIGVWGAFDFNGYSEADPYLSYTFKSGFSFGLTDYYLTGLPVFDISDTSGSHALEINAGFVNGGLSLNANYIINEAGGAGSAGGDMYFQVEYSFGDFSLFIGAGDGWHTTDGKFNVCNIGLGSTRQITVSEKFSIPVSGQVILNPEREELHLVVGFSFY